MEWALLAVCAFAIVPSLVALEPVKDWYFPLVEDVEFNDKYRTEHPARAENGYNAFAYEFAHGNINSHLALIFFNVEWCQVVSLHIGPQFRVKLYPSGAYYEIYDGKTLKGTHEFHSTVMEIYPEGNTFYFYVDGSAYTAYSGQESANKEYAQPTAAFDGKEGVRLVVFASSPYCAVFPSYDGIVTDNGRAYFYRERSVPHSYYDPVYPGRTLPTVLNTAGSKKAEKCPSPLELAYFMADDVWAEEPNVNWLEYEVTLKPNGKGSWPYILLEVALEQCDWLRICFQKECTDNSRSLDILYRNQVYFRTDDDRPYPFPVPIASFQALTLYSDQTKMQIDVAGLESQRLFDVQMHLDIDSAVYPNKPLRLYLQRAPNCKARLLTEPFSKRTAVCQNGPMA